MKISFKIFFCVILSFVILFETSSQNYSAIRTVIVGFDSQYEKGYDPIHVKYNELIPKPSWLPTKVGYTFKGWYKDREGLIPWDFNKNRATKEGITLYAKWEHGVKDANVIWNDLIVNGLKTDIEIDAYFNLPLEYNMVVGEDVIITSSNPDIIKVSPQGCVDFIGLGSADLTINIPSNKSSVTKTFNVLEAAEFNRYFSNNFFFEQISGAAISFGRHYYGNDYEREHLQHYHYYDRIDEKFVIFQDVGDVGRSHIKNSYDEYDYEYEIDYRVTSSDPSVVKVNKNGSVKCIRPGRSIITISVMNHEEINQVKTYKQTIDVMDYSEKFFTTQITQAYKDPSYSKYLSKKSLAVLNKAKSVIAKVIKPNMTDLQKEKAIHDYIVLNTSYGYYKNVTDSTPYSCLIYGKATCQGYAQTFAMFMTMLNIENNYVIGDAGGEPHAWNRVKIGNVWYNVDTTWDDPLPDLGKVRHKYFNNSDQQFFKDHSEGNGGQTLPSGMNVS